MARVIGIDLGTTNSVVAVLEGGEPTVIPNHWTQRRTGHTRRIGAGGSREPVGGGAQVGVPAFHRGRLVDVGAPVVLVPGHEPAGRPDAGAVAVDDAGGVSDGVALPRVAVREDVRCAGRGSGGHCRLGLD